jgi:2-polyprenyl-6-methoxyphenol hydroxylase-like FAD-dependent oxidoreductase
MRRVEAVVLKLDSEVGYEDIKDRYGSPWFLLHRADLHQELRNLLQRVSENVQNELASKVTSIDCHAPILALADGRMIQKELVIIAD